MNLDFGPFLYIIIILPVIVNMPSIVMIGCAQFSQFSKYFLFVLFSMYNISYNTATFSNCCTNH